MPCNPRGLDQGSLIYLASPYSYTTGATVAANQLMMEWNFQKVSEIAFEFMQKGYVVFCPIAHSHPVAMYGDPDVQEDWRFWSKQDLEMLSRCDALVQACMPLWSKSQGAKAERTYADYLGMHVSYTRAYFYDIDFRLLDRGIL